jgi:hypothetical protein
VAIRSGCLPGPAPAPLRPAPARREGSPRWLDSFDSCTPRPRWYASSRVEPSPRRSRGSEVGYAAAESFATVARQRGFLGSAFPVTKPSRGPEHGRANRQTMSDARAGRRSRRLPPGAPCGLGFRLSANARVGDVRGRIARCARPRKARSAQAKLHDVVDGKQPARRARPAPGIDAPERRVVRVGAVSDGSSERKAWSPTSDVEGHEREQDRDS